VRRANAVALLSGNFPDRLGHAMCLVGSGG
jgi:hypothetical protein